MTTTRRKKGARPLVAPIEVQSEARDLQRMLARLSPQERLWWDELEAVAAKQSELDQVAGSRPVNPDQAQLIATLRGWFLLRLVWLHREVSADRLCSDAHEIAMRFGAQVVLEVLGPAPARSIH